jgi:putative DNA-invertase from lambdoid prophage Rac
MLQAVRDALIAFMAATAQAQAERAYLGRKPSFTRKQFEQVRALVAQEALGIAGIAQETGLTRQTVYRIKDNPASAEAALAVWGL